MSNMVSWNLQMSVREGQLDAARALMAEMVVGTQEEVGTMGYEWFLSADGSLCHTNERFADSGAAMAHLGNFGTNFAERFMQCFAPTSISVYGEPTDEVRAALDAFGAIYLGNFGGFTR